ncbi:MAG: hypothetical protein HRF43_06180, partial [Phycisphaerae bacterium]
FGGPPGKADDLAAARAYIEDLAAHHINVQMPQIGSAAVQSFLKDPAGREFFRARGMSLIATAPGKFGISDTAAIYVHDEPDAGDYRMEGVPEDRKIGGLATWCIEHAEELRAGDPGVPHMLNVDSTYKPHNLHTYGQVCDILATDPYFQARLADAWSKRPERIPLYRKITYLLAVAAAAESACAPRPLHVILYAVQNRGEIAGRQFRFAAPEEKRIELYYALAAGARGFSYWWYTPGARSHGIGAAASDPDAARLWAEIGRLGAEVRTAGPLIVRSCPADVSVRADPPALWTRCLLTDDALLLLAVNDDHRVEQHRFEYTPIRDATCRVRLPAWLEPRAVFEITARGLQDVKADRDGAELRMELGTVEVTRLIVVTHDPALRKQLEGLYRNRFAGKADALENR